MAQKLKTHNRYVLVIIDNYSKFGWAVPLKKKLTQTRKKIISRLLRFLKKPKLIENDGEGEDVSKILTDFFNRSNNKRSSRHKSRGEVFAGRFKRTISDLLRKPLFVKGHAKF